jgi:hypothetical protein
MSLALREYLSTLSMLQSITDADESVSSISCEVFVMWRGFGTDVFSSEGSWNELIVTRTGSHGYGISRYHPVSNTWRHDRMA